MPMQYDIEPIEVRTRTGRRTDGRRPPPFRSLPMRLPPDLYRALQQEADRQNLSLQKLCQWLLRESLLNLAEDSEIDDLSKQEIKRRAAQVRAEHLERKRRGQ